MWTSKESMALTELLTKPSKDRRARKPCTHASRSETYRLPCTTKLKKREGSRTNRHTVASSNADDNLVLAGSLPCSNHSETNTWCDPLLPIAHQHKGRPVVRMGKAGRSIEVCKVRWRPDCTVQQISFGLLKSLRFGQRSSRSDPELVEVGH
jgi:hypothetical protein